MTNPAAKTGFLFMAMALKLIKGGKVNSGSDYTYISGCVTDTRLMGVLGLHLHWKYLPQGEKEYSHLHQYFYYDIEEIGLDSIKVYDFDDEESARLAEKASFGGLGAEMRNVSEKEGRYLVCSFVEGTKKKDQPLPPEASDLSFILDHPVTLDEDEMRKLNRKLCTDIKSENEIVNYYLMRVFGKDKEGADLLKKKGMPEDCFEDVSLPKHATFLQNSIDVFVDENGNKSYLAESLVESQNGYWICISELVLDWKSVASVKKRSRMHISTSEASLLLNTDEYVTVFEIETDMDYFDMEFAAYVVGATKTSHETGDMFMEFKTTNNHVAKDKFRLSDDIFAIYYSTDFGQLIVGTYSPNEASFAEARLALTFNKDLRCTGRYHFAQSVIYEFALSGYDDFEEFLSSIE